MLSYQQLLDIQQAIAGGQKPISTRNQPHARHLQQHARGPWVEDVEAQISTEVQTNYRQFVESGAPTYLLRAERLAVIFRSSGALQGRLKIDLSAFRSLCSKAQLGMSDRADAAFYSAALSHNIPYLGFTDYERPQKYLEIADRQDLPPPAAFQPLQRFRTIYLADMDHLSPEYDVLRRAVLEVLEMTERFAVQCGGGVQGIYCAQFGGAGSGELEEASVFRGSSYPKGSSQTGGQIRPEERICLTQSALAAKSRLSAGQSGPEDRQSSVGQFSNPETSPKQLTPPALPAPALCFCFEYCSCLAAPFCLLYDDAQTAARAFFGLYRHCFWQLHDAEALARLVVSTRELLAAVCCEVVGYLKALDIALEDIIMPWFLSAFTSLLTPREAFYLWDCAVQEKSVACFSAAAAAVLALKAGTVGCFGDAKDVRISLQEAKDLRILPAVAYIFRFSLRAPAAQKPPQLERFDGPQRPLPPNRGLNGAE